MSWYKDPQLFLLLLGLPSGYYIKTIRKEFGSTIVTSDLQEFAKLNFSEHLSLGFNKESDYNAFKATFPQSGNLSKLINFQGSVIYCDYGNETSTWSREAPNSTFWSLPGITTKLLADKQALAEENSELKAKNFTLQDEVNNSKVEKEAIDKRVLYLEAENAILKAQFNRDKDEKGEEIVLAGLEALQQQVTDLTSKLVPCCGVAGGGSPVKEPWISGQTVPSTWVPFGELGVQAFSENIPLTITKATGGLKFGDDNTTNIQANRFYGGIFPIVVVDVAELTPNREDARFDPCIWGLYNNAGISYAARKPFASEMSFDAHTRLVNMSSNQPAEASVRENLQGHFHA